jgi:sporulation protein YlmC with PRC-barrel domain
MQRSVSMNKIVVFSSLFALAMASPVLAADDRPMQQSQAQETQQPIQPQASAQQPEQSESKQTVPYQAAASKLMDKSVQDSQGEKVGSVSDLLLDENHEVSHVVISSGGVLGMGGRDVAVPMDQIQTQGENLVYQGSKQEIENQPEFAYQEEQQQQQQQQTAQSETRPLESETQQATAEIESETEEATAEIEEQTDEATAEIEEEEPQG